MINAELENKQIIPVIYEANILEQAIQATKQTERFYAIDLL